jgi:hypothetical protein
MYLNQQRTKRDEKSTLVLSRSGGLSPGLPRRDTAASFGYPTTFQGSRGGDDERQSDLERSPSKNRSRVATAQPRRTPR